MRRFSWWRGLVAITAGSAAVSLLVWAAARLTGWDWLSGPLLLLFGLVAADLTYPWVFRPPECGLCGEPNAEGGLFHRRCVEEEAVRADRDD